MAEEAAAEGKSFGFVIAPASYFEAATEGSGEACDYIRALAGLEAQGASPALRMTCLPVEENGRLMIQGSIVSILYENTNLDFSAVAYVETNSGGEVSYEYAAFAEGDCLTNARSVCYVASAALNDGDREYSEGQKELLRGFVGRGIDLAAGLDEEVSAAVASREISVQVSAPSAPLETGERETLSASVTVRYPEDAYPRDGGRPRILNSSAPEVFAVDRYGIIEAKGDGSAAISACVGEVSASVTAVCENAVYYDCTVSEEGGRGLLNLSPSSFSVRAGESFSVTVTVSDYEGYGEMSFWVGETLYTTEDGSVALELTADGDTSFVLASLSSSLDYFTVTGNSVIAGTQRDKTNLPDKLILPRYSEDGELLTEIAQYAFRGSGNTPAARYSNLAGTDHSRQLPVRPRRRVCGLFGARAHHSLRRCTGGGQCDNGEHKVGRVRRRGGNMRAGRYGREVREQQILGRTGGVCDGMRLHPVRDDACGRGVYRRKKGVFVKFLQKAGRV